jgi:Flp pilus assembly protein TadG
MAAIVRLARRACGERGAELIEMAIITPVLLLIMAAIFDFAMMFRSWEVVTNAAREGARIGVLPSYSAEDIRLRVREYMRVSGVAAECTMDPEDSCSTQVVDCHVCVETRTITLDSGGSVSTRVVTVSSRQRLPSLSVIGDFFGGNFNSINVRSASMMRNEVPAAP